MGVKPSGRRLLVGEGLRAWPALYGHHEGYLVRVRVGVGVRVKVRVGVGVMVGVRVRVKVRVRVRVKVRVRLGIKGTSTERPPGEGRGVAWVGSGWVQG